MPADGLAIPASRGAPALLLTRSGPVRRGRYNFNKLVYQGLDQASCPRWFFPLPPCASLQVVNMR